MEVRPGRGGGGVRHMRPDQAKCITTPETPLYLDINTYGGVFLFRSMSVVFVKVIPKQNAAQPV